MTKEKSLKYVWEHSQDLAVNHAVEIINKLYANGKAETWFIGTGWPEGYNYCQNQNYLQLTGAPALLKHNKRALWFAITLIKL